MVEEEIHFYENPDEFDLPAVAVVGKGDGFVWNEGKNELQEKGIRLR